MENTTTIEQIRLACGYERLDALRQAWHGEFTKAVPFPARAEPIAREQAIKFLHRLARPYPNKAEAAIQGALSMLEDLRKGQPVQAPASPPVQASPPVKSKPIVAKPKKEVVPEANAASIAEEARVKIMLEREAEDRAKRERYAALEEAERLEAARLNKMLGPWVAGLTWCLNYLEMLFLIVGLYMAAGLMGLIVGLFLLVLGSIVLLMVRLNGSAGGYAVAAWFFVCSIGGWLVEFPAVLLAVETTNSIVVDGNTTSGISVQAYAMLVTVLMSGSSFAGTYFRYLKTRD